MAKLLVIIVIVLLVEQFITLMKIAKLLVIIAAVLLAVPFITRSVAPAPSDLTIVPWATLRPTARMVATWMRWEGILLHFVI
ncbi:hypothetical protein PAHAL_9G249200 [Panicum hallii]|uniref:Uncharacterized protein n=1 Tax=Panicum hallii TaxID=206008 RepID=A0A2T8I2G7_9POAL|nr:hypothetical protein PAHAL_9G249200 [Panicum hallii]